MIRKPTLLLLLATLLSLTLLTACGKDDPASPDNTPLKVLVMSDGGTEGHVLAALGAAGLDTTRGGPWQDDPGPDLHAFDVVVLLNGYDYGYTMADSVQQKYVDYVAGGGGLVVTEWFNYYQDDNPLLSGIMPVKQNRSYDYEMETLHPVSGNPLAAGLPASFTTGPDWSWITLVPDTTATKQATVAVTGDLGGPAVVTGVHGLGRVVAWGMAGIYEGDNIWTDGVDQLLEHIVDWAGRRR